MTRWARSDEVGQTVTVRIPIAFRPHGGRKIIVAPVASPRDPLVRPRPNTALVRALARAFRWRKLLENGDLATCEEVARAELLNSSYVSRVLRLTLLAPAVVEAALDGRQSSNLRLGTLLNEFPVEWEEQQQLLSRG